MTRKWEKSGLLSEKKKKTNPPGFIVFMTSVSSAKNNTGFPCYLTA